jgi:hypothetical protein
MINWNGFGWKRSWPNPDVCLEVLRKTIATLSQNSRCLRESITEHLTNNRAIQERYS